MTCAVLLPLEITLLSNLKPQISILEVKQPATTMRLFFQTATAIYNRSMQNAKVFINDGQCFPLDRRTALECVKKQDVQLFIPYRAEEAR